MSSSLVGVRACVRFCALVCVSTIDVAGGVGCDGGVVSERGDVGVVAPTVVMVVMVMWWCGGVVVWWWCGGGGVVV